MIVFHGSNQIVKEPNISYSKNYLDFGKGFYITTFQNQAEKWAKRKASRYGGNAILNVYEFYDDLSKFNVLRFEQEDEKWLDFVFNCRKGLEINKDYDLIIGNVADDDVFKTVDMYFRGIWTKEQTIEQLKYYKMNDQICIVNQNVLDTLLKFSKYHTVN